MQQRLLRNDGGPRTFAVVLDTGDEVSSKGAAQQDIGYAVIASGRRRSRIQKLARCRPGLSHRLGGAHRQRGGRRNGDHHARTEFLGRIPHRRQYCTTMDCNPSSGPGSPASTAPPASGLRVAPVRRANGRSPTAAWPCSPWCCLARGLRDHQDRVEALAGPPLRRAGARRSEPRSGNRQVIGAGSNQELRAQGVRVLRKSACSVSSGSSVKIKASCQAVLASKITQMRDGPATGR